MTVQEKLKAATTAGLEIGLIEVVPGTIADSHTPLSSIMHRKESVARAYPALRMHAQRASNLGWAEILADANGQMWKQSSDGGRLALRLRFDLEACFVDGNW